MRNLKLYLFLVFSLSLFSFYSCKSSSEVNNSYNGIWSGEVNGQRVQFTCDSKDKVYLVIYPSTGCSGYWKLKESSSNKLKFVETIEIGQGKCNEPNLIIVLQKINSYEMRISYYSPDGKTEISNSILTKG